MGIFVYDVMYRELIYSENKMHIIETYQQNYKFSKCIVIEEKIVKKVSDFWKVKMDILLRSEWVIVLNEFIYSNKCNK